MGIDFDKLRETFFEEVRELTVDMESAFLALEAAPDDRETIDRIFRAVHSIKGGSGTFGFDDVTKTAHALESLLDRMRSGALRATRTHIDVLLSSRDVLSALLAARQRGEVSTMDVGPCLANIRQLMDQGLTSTAAYRLRVRPLRAGAQEPLQLLAALATLGRVRESKLDAAAIPSLDLLDPEALHVVFDLVLETTASEAEINALLSAIDGDVSVDRIGGPAVAPVVAAAGPAAAVVAAPVRAQGVESSSIRVTIEKLDGLMNLVGELVIAQSMVADVIANFDPSKLVVLQQAAAELERQTRELQERVMAVRMVPVGTVFHRFPRLVRDVSAQCGKQVTLELQGDETELDKSVVERIADPLTHLVRNCIDHGIEPVDARVKAGKPAHGTVKLVAFHRGGSVFIQISDDGRGLDTARILAKAIERGLAPRDAVMTEDQIHALIFAPGFSTAEKVSDLSGRGVGMDVVKRSVESMGGTVSIATTMGAGTTFTIRLPLTLAILDGQYFSLGDSTFVVPLLSIRESLRLKAGEVKRVLGKGELVMVRGEPIPLVRLREVFTTGGTPATDPLVVVVESEGAVMAIEVDALLAQSQVVIKNIETHYQRVDGIMGATIMGNGQVAMIIDVQSLFRVSLRPRGSDSAQLEERAL